MSNQPGLPGSLGVPGALAPQCDWDCGCGGGGDCYCCKGPQVYMRCPNEHCWRIVPEEVCCDKKKKKKHHHHHKKKKHHHHKKGHKKSDGHSKSHEHGCKNKTKGDKQKKRRCSSSGSDSDSCSDSDSSDDNAIEIVIINTPCPDECGGGGGGNAQECGCAAVIYTLTGFVTGYAVGVVPTASQLARFQAQAAGYIYCRTKCTTCYLPDVAALNSLITYLSVPGTTYDATANALAQQAIVALQSVCTFC